MKNHRRTLRRLSVVAPLVALAATPLSPQVSSDRFSDYIDHHRREHELEAAALLTAKQASDLRLDQMNELRAQIDSERGTYITRSLYDARREQVDERLSSMEKKIVAAEATSRTWALAIGGFVTAFQVGLVILFRMMPARTAQRKESAP